MTTMTDMHGSVRPAQNVHAAIVDGEAVLLDMRTDEFVGLNEVATRMWESLVAGETLEETAKGIEREYEVDPDKARLDVAKFVESMVERCILEYQ